jgi:DNA-binding IclR family transcriptional regulator
MSEYITTATRRRLPNRREHGLIDFEHEGRRYAAGIGRFEDGGLAEIFMNVSGRAGATVEVLARDTAVAASLCLQFGCNAETLRRALMRDTHGRASVPVGQLLDLLAAAREPTSEHLQCS